MPFFFFVFPVSPKIESNVLLESTTCALRGLSAEPDTARCPSGATPAGSGSASRPTLMNDARLLAAGLELRLPGARRPGPGEGARSGEPGGGIEAGIDGS